MLFPSQCPQPPGLMGDKEGTVSQGTRSTSPADEGPSLVLVGAASPLWRGALLPHWDGVGVGGTVPSPL